MPETSSAADFAGIVGEQAWCRGRLLQVLMLSLTRVLQDLGPEPCQVVCDHCGEIDHDISSCPQVLADLVEAICDLIDLIDLERLGVT